jgi:hypothetical protein
MFLAQLLESLFAIFPIGNDTCVEFSIIKLSGFDFCRLPPFPGPGRVPSTPSHWKNLKVLSENGMALKQPGWIILISQSSQHFLDSSPVSLGCM